MKGKQGRGQIRRIKKEGKRDKEERKVEIGERKQGSEQ